MRTKRTSAPRSSSLFCTGVPVRHQRKDADKLIMALKRVVDCERMLWAAPHKKKAVSKFLRAVLKVGGGPNGAYDGMVGVPSSSTILYQMNDCKALCRFETSARTVS